MTPAALSHIDPARLPEAFDVIRGTDWIDRAHGDAAFGLWMALVDNRIMRRVGLGLFDLADAPIRDFYDDGMTPREAAGLVLEADDTFAA